MAVVVIGAGAGGLASAIMLAARGENVTVLESQAGPGGKMLPVTMSGRRFDSGPTVLTMRWVFEELFQQAGSGFAQNLALEPLDVLARHYWTGGQCLDLFANHENSVSAIADFAGPAESEGYRNFAAAARRIHAALLTPFLKSNRPTPWSLAMTMPPWDIFSINPFETLWGALGRYFKDARLRQLFGRYATYCGSSPFTAPATLMLIADVEAQGVWRVQGGIAALADALHACAEGCGATFRFDTSAIRIELQNGAISGVIDSRGIRHACSAVVVNADSAAVAAGLFGDGVSHATTAPADEERSLSAMTWCGFTTESGVPLAHHTVFFSDDYEAEFRALKTGPSRDPTVYVCDQGEGRKLLLINAPANGEAAPEHAQADVLARLAACGLRLNFAGESPQQRHPKDFAHLYPATHGALYGRASHGWMSTFLRPQARTVVPGLYLAGGSTHPGPGVPMAVLSGMRAAEALLSDRPSTRQSRATATDGGISTR